ncbi:pseudaminic acid synthase [Candidatus Pelagibacter sp.]|nr:pseudaminic acid synthase [Candidatus Pelagibacter sp.]
MKIKIGNKNINSLSKPYVIAEISANHGGSLKKCFKLIDIISKSGANAVKIQTYKPQSITINSKRKEFLIKNLENKWDNNYLFDLFKQSFLPWSWIKKIQMYCKKKKIFFFSSVFDEEGLILLRKLNLQAYKVSSFEFNHTPLIKKISETKKPLIFSTGISNYSEIKKMNKFIKSLTNNYALLHCVSSYPANAEDYNLNLIKKMKKDFKVVIGISDHTDSNIVGILGTFLGAKIFEKHVKLDEDIKSADSDFSLPVSKLEDYIKSINSSWKLASKKGIKLNIKKKYSKFKRSIYLVKSLKKGQKISKSDLKVIRPGYGIEPLYFERIIGKKVNKNLTAPIPLKKNDIKKI